MNHLNVSILLLGLFSFSVLAQETMLVIDSGDNPTRNQLLAQKAKARGQNIVFYPGPGKKIESDKLRKFLSTAKFNTLILAGHSGDGDFGGSKGTITKEDILAGISQNEYARKNCHELLTLGCNTANKSKAWYYRAMFEDLKILHGYSGSAPLSYRKNAVAYVNDFFTNADKLKNAKTEEELAQVIEGMKSVDQVNSGLYVSCDAGEFYYSHEGSDEENPIPTTGVLEKYELMAGCDEKQREFVSKYQSGLNDYLLGLKEPEADTSQGFLREAYTFINRNEQCLQTEELSFSVSKAMFLLFNKNFMTNFTTYYKPLFESALKEVETLEKQANLQATLEKALAEKEKEMQSCLADITACRARHETALKELEKYSIEFDALIRRGNLTETDYARIRELAPLYTLRSTIQGMDLQSDLKDQLKYIGEERAFIKANGTKLNESLKTYKTVLNKLVKDPTNVTRKDLHNFTDLNTYFFRNVLLQNEGMNSAISYAYDLDGEVPFSWHEAPKGKIQPPNDSYLTVENLQTPTAGLSPEVIEMRGYGW